MIIVIDGWAWTVTLYWIFIWMLLLAGPIVAAIKHGEPRDQNYNFWLSLLSFLIILPVILKGMGVI